MRAMMEDEEEGEDDVDAEVLVKVDEAAPYFGESEEEGPRPADLDFADRVRLVLRE